MKLIKIDPRLLRDNPDNPRRTASSPDANAALLANVRAVGILQPPIARERDEEVVLIAGHRRRDAAIAAELTPIDVLVWEPGDDQVDGGDGVRALSENMVRAAMNPVDQWRAIEALVGEAWTEDAIAAALNLPVRRIRALRHLANVHPAMLDQMARGDMPNDGQLRIIGLASRDEQASVWKKLRPKKGERASWHSISHALEKRRMPFSVAKFGAAETEAFGIRWEDDLFAPAGEEARYTTQVDAFLQAQLAWLETNLPKKGVILETGSYGQPELPPKAHRVYSSKPGPQDQVGCYVDPRSGEIEQVIFQLPQPKEKSRSNGKTSAGGAGEVYAKPARPELSQKGAVMVGDLRTEALHTAFAQAEIPDQALIGLLVLALAGQNISIRSGTGGEGGFYGQRAALAASITEGGVLTSDPEALRNAARGMLREALSCRIGYGASGMVARYAGIAVDADRYLPNTATEEFLGNLSKAAIEATAKAVSVLPRNTGKATRAAIVEHLDGTTFIHPLAGFSLTDEERRKEAERRADLAPDGDEDIDDAGEGRDTAPGPDAPEEDPVAPAPAAEASSAEAARG